MMFQHLCGHCLERHDTHPSPRCYLFRPMSRDLPTLRARLRQRYTAIDSVTPFRNLKLNRRFEDFCLHCGWHMTEHAWYAQIGEPVRITCLLRPTQFFWEPEHGAARGAV